MRMEIGQRRNTCLFAKRTVTSQLAPARRISDDDESARASNLKRGLLIGVKGVQIELLGRQYHGVTVGR